MVSVLVMVATEREIMAIAPMGMGFKMMPVMVAIKIARRCQPCSLRPSG